MPANTMRFALQTENVKSDLGIWHMFSWVLTRAGSV